MPRLLTEHDARASARILADLAKALEDGCSPRGALRRANEWAGYLRGTNTDPGRSGGAGDPTGQAATSRGDTMAELALKIAANVRLAVDAAESALWLLAEVPAPVVATADASAQDARDDLDAANRRAGDCEVCAKTCTGARDDRLTRLVVPWSTWSKGVEVERSEERQVCAACRMSWGRAGARHGNAHFDEWERLRRAGLELEDAG